MDDSTVNVDQVDSARTGEMGEERVTWRHAVRVEPSQAKTAPDECALLHDF